MKFQTTQRVGPKREFDADDALFTCRRLVQPALPFNRATMAHSSVCIPIRKDAQGFVMAPNDSVDFEGVHR